MRMTSNQFTRVYFSRYFFSAYRSSLSKYAKVSPFYKNAPKDIYFFSDPYVFNRLSRSSIQKPLTFAGLSQAQSFFFNFKFAISSNLYDYSWQPYKNDEEFFKKFFIIFIRIKLKLVSSHEYNIQLLTKFFQNKFLNK